VTQTTTSLTRRARVLAVGAALLLGVGALAGCSAHPGQAVIVNYTDADGGSSTVVISEQELQGAVEDLNEYYAAVGGQGTSAVYAANALIELPLLEQAGAEYGVTYSDAEALAELRQGAGDVDYSPAAVSVFRYSELASMIVARDDQDAVVARLEELRGGVSLETSPRYEGGGAWLLRYDTQF